MAKATTDKPYIDMSAEEQVEALKPKIAEWLKGRVTDAYPLPWWLHLTTLEELRKAYPGTTVSIHDEVEYLVFPPRLH